MLRYATEKPRAYANKANAESQLPAPGRAPPERMPAAPEASAPPIRRRLVKLVASAWPPSRRPDTGASWRQKPAWRAASGGARSGVHGSSSAPAPASRPSRQAGATFWFTRNTLSGSYLFLRPARRSKLAPYAALTLLVLADEVDVHTPCRELVRWRRRTPEPRRRTTSSSFGFLPAGVDVHDELGVAMRVGGGVGRHPSSGRALPSAPRRSRFAGEGSLAAYSRMVSMASSDISAKLCDFQ